MPMPEHTKDAAGSSRGMRLREKSLRDFDKNLDTYFFGEEGIQKDKKKLHFPSSQPITPTLPQSIP